MHDLANQATIKPIFTDQVISQSNIVQVHRSALIVVLRLALSLYFPEVNQSLEVLSFIRLHENLRHMGKGRQYDRRYAVDVLYGVNIGFQDSRMPTSKSI